MRPTFLCYAGCSTCQKAKKWLTDNGIAFEERPIREQHPSAQELRAWQRQSGLPMKRFFNTSGLQYRALNLKDRLPQMGEEEMLSLLAADGMLVKRPLLITDAAVLMGFRPAEWEQALRP